MFMLQVTDINQKAVDYVGTTPEEGVLQLNILIQEGLKAYHKVLEIGCGALIAGFPIMQYLNKGNYVGIDPNRWLWEDSMKVIKTKKSPCLLQNGNFNAIGEYDFTIGHSVLSHCSRSQVLEFLDQCHRYGKCFMSLRLAEGNKYCHSWDETDWEEWTYPGATFHKWAWIKSECKKRDLKVRKRFDITEQFVKVHESACHDWLEIT